jgi:hypothetical protein
MTNLMMASQKLQEVPEVKGADRLEDIVEFFMHCMVNNPTERRKVYIGKPYLDRRVRSSPEGLGYYNTVGALLKKGRYLFE